MGEIIESTKLEMLRELSDGTDELLIQLLDSYIPLAKKEIETIRTLGSPEKIDLLRERLHSLKGSSANLGIDSMIESIQSMQTEAKSGDYSRFDHHSARMEEILGLVQEFRNGLS